MPSAAAALDVAAGLDADGDAPPETPKAVLEAVARTGKPVEDWEGGRAEGEGLEPSLEAKQKPQDPQETKWKHMKTTKNHQKNHQTVMLMEIEDYVLIRESWMLDGGTSE